MNQNDKNERTKEISLPKTFTSDLRGRQSVRATFKLSEGCIEALSIVATHLGIKQKSLFDHLVEDARTLKSIAREIQNIKITKRDRIQKTFVLSRRSLLSLENVSKNFNAPRDALVELSVQRLFPIIAKEREKHGACHPPSDQVCDDFTRRHLCTPDADHIMEGKSSKFHRAKNEHFHGL